ncbi:hypothetical protein BDE02_09G054400, partial [Populus trichocarpa]
MIKLTLRVENSNLHCVADVDNKSVSDICFRKPLHGCVHIIHRDNLNICRDVVLGSKINHLLCFLHSSYGTPSHYFSSCQANNMEFVA